MHRRRPPLLPTAPPLLLLAPLLAVAASAILTGAGPGSGGPQLLLQAPDDLCLGCLCEATTNCNLTFGCSRDGELCGPFLLSQPYWLDAGAPLLAGDAAQRPGAFERCAQDPYCSAQTVRSYMNRFAQDCNGNGQVECDDFGRLHYLGGYQCTQPLESGLYYRVFRQCLDSIQQLSG